MPKRSDTARPATAPPAATPHDTTIAELMRLAIAIEEGRWNERAAGSDPLLATVNRIVEALTAPIAVTTERLEKLANGCIPPRITEEFKGGFTPLKSSLNHCLDQLDGLSAEIFHMSEEHNKGDIDVVINAERFEGVYRQMAMGVNDMVGGHIAVKKKAMACVNHFSMGNFDAVLEPFPGKKAFINDTIERLRAAVRKFIAEMSRMSEEHGKGDIDVAIPANHFEGAF